MPGSEDGDTNGMKTVAAALFLFICATLTPESPRVLRAPVWIYLEPVPGSFSESAPQKNPPVEELRETARYILSGMAGGWNFSYVPSDPRRNVSEEFTLVPILPVQSDDPRFSMDSLTPEYPRLTCWAQFTVDDAVARRLNYWESIRFVPGKGRGTGERTKESAGIQDAYKNAVLNAVRTIARGLEKNKPKEITGEVLLREGPRLFADEGRFVAEVRVLVNIREVVPYTLY